jgi:cyclase
MLRTRVIPCLLLQDQGLVKTVKFKDPTYVGDPINAVRIFNEKEVDELIFLDITASRGNRPPNLDTIRSIASRCFMPFCYGGGVRDTETIGKILSLGAEKVAINSQALKQPQLIRKAADIFGSQSIVAGIDVKKNIFGRYRVHDSGKGSATDLDPVAHAVEMERLGAGEILLTSVDRDGTRQGYDLELIRRVTDAVGIPVIACGGAGQMQDFADAVITGGASAVAAGSMFVFYGKHRAVLINYPDLAEMERLLA